MKKFVSYSRVRSPIFWVTIWAGFGLVGNIEKTILADYEQLLRAFFSCFQGQKKVLNFFKNIVVSALKSCIK